MLPARPVGRQGGQTTPKECSFHMITWLTYSKNVFLSVDFTIKNAHISLIFDKNSLSTISEFLPLYHIHSAYELFFVEQGECTIKIAGDDYVLNANSFIVVPAGASHNVCRKSDDARIFPISIQFDKTRAHSGELNIDFFELLHTLLSQNDEPRVFCECFRIFKTFDVLLKTFQNIHKPLYEEYFEHVAIQFFIDFIYCMDMEAIIPKFVPDKLPVDSLHGNTAGDNEKIKKFYTGIIEEYLTDLANKKVSLPELADKLQLSTVHTSRLIKRFYNTDFSNLFTCTRMNMAKSMIFETDLSLDNISEQIGYSYKGFLAAFKRVTGKTPAECRKKGY